MTDREMLELAAKAGGYARHEYVENSARDGRVVTGHYDSLLEVCINPLTDDGDALRLAVELRFDLNFQRTGRERIVQVYSSRIGKWVSETYRDNDDSCAVMRKVIVLAAASIGKTGEPT